MSEMISPDAANTVETPSPAPTPSRAMYGFSLWLLSYCTAGLYISWAFLPEEWLCQAGFTYRPQRYWAIAVPAYITTCLFIFTFIIYPCTNLTMTPRFDDIRTITDEYSVPQPGPGIAPISDIPITEVCRHLYSSQ